MEGQFDGGVVGWKLGGWWVHGWRGGWMELGGWLNGGEVGWMGGRMKGW